MGEIMRRVAGQADFSNVRSFVSSLPSFNFFSFASFLALFSGFFLVVFTLSAPSSAERDFAVPS
jgi:hypothetical protein